MLSPSDLVCISSVTSYRRPHVEVAPDDDDESVALHVDDEAIPGNSSAPAIPVQIVIC